MSKNIPKTDYIIDVNKTIKQNISNQLFDVIISSHNFEHFPNLIQALNDYSSILNDDGIIVSFIPDCRFEFDKLRNETSISEILSDYYNKVTSSSFRNIIDLKILKCENDPILHWNNYNKTLYSGNIHDIKQQEIIKDDKYKTFILNNSRKQIEKLFLESKNKYIDTHNYTFTSITFERYLHFLFHYKYIDLVPLRIYHTQKNSHEFCVILKKKKS